MGDPSVQTSRGQEERREIWGLQAQTSGFTQGWAGHWRRPVRCVRSSPAGPAGAWLGGWGPREGTISEATGQVWRAPADAVASPCTPQGCGCHFLTLMAATGAQPRPACLANLRRGPGRQPGSRRPSACPQLTGSGCMPCSPWCPSQKDPEKGELA